mgnify:CR=1 FL=1
MAWQNEVIGFWSRKIYPKYHLSSRAVQVFRTARTMEATPPIKRPRELSLVEMWHTMNGLGRGTMPPLTTTMCLPMFPYSSYPQFFARPAPILTASDALLANVAASPAIRASVSTFAPRAPSLTSPISSHAPREAECATGAAAEDSADRIKTNLFEAFKSETAATQKFVKASFIMSKVPGSAPYLGEFQRILRYFAHIGIAEERVEEYGTMRKRRFRWLGLWLFRFPNSTAVQHN